MSAAPSAAPGHRRWRRRLVAVLLSTVLSLLLAEVAVRLFAGYPLSSLQLQQPPAVEGADLDATRDLIDEFLAAAPPGLDRDWFRKSPPLLARRDVPAELVGARLPWQGLPHYYVYNSNLVAQLKADRRLLVGLFGEPAPASLRVFDVGIEGEYPRYRYPPDTTLPSGLVVNNLGFRGPQMTLEKPPRTVRVACVGASTTVNNHGMVFSYPERLQHMLDLWTAARGLDVHVEVVNAGREGLQSTDILAVVRQEVLPLAADYVVYYEGQNQFDLFGLFRHEDGRVATPEPTPDGAVPPWPGTAPPDAGPLAWLLQHSAVAERLRSVLRHGQVLREPPKPQLSLQLPPGLDEGDPALDQLAGVVNLPTVLRDLDAARTACAAADARFVLCTFASVVSDGMELDAQTRRDMFAVINRTFWPLRYADIARIWTLQNRVYAAWARSRGVDLIDVAGRMPKDQRLYTDMIHNTEIGIRFRAWCVFERLTGILERDLAPGRVPNGRPAAATHPALAAPRTVQLGGS